MGITNNESAVFAKLIKFASELIYTVIEDEEERKKYEKELESIIESLE